MKETSPVCYGALTLFSSDSHKCTDCPERAGCETQVRERLASLQERFKTNALMEEHRKIRVRVRLSTPKARPTVNDRVEVPIPEDFDMKKAIQADAKATVGMLSEVGGADFVLTNMRAGRNPFKSSHKGLYWCGSKLKEGSFTTEDLTAHLGESCPHPLAAKALATGIVGALMATKVVAKNGNELSLSRP